MKLVINCIIVAIIMIYLILTSRTSLMDQEKALWTTYLDTIASLTDQPTQPLKLSSFPTFKIDRYENIGARSTIDIVDLWRLRQCELHFVIAERNSNLGKLAGASQQLLFELRFLALAPDCIPIASEYPELKKTLEATVANKQTQLPSSIAHAVLHSREWQNYWQIPINDQATDGSAGTHLAGKLDSLSKQWLSGDYSNIAQVEHVLGELYRSNAGGWLTQRMQSYLTGLRAANSLLMNATLPCVGSGTTYSKRRMRGVIEQHFGRRIQAHYAPYYAQFSQLLLSTNNLEHRLEITSPRYYQWRSERNALLNEIKAAAIRHSKLANRVLAMCQNGSIH